MVKYIGDNPKFTHMQMQSSREKSSLDDDMVDGDLGNGMEARTASTSTRMKSQSFAGVTETELSQLERLGCSRQTFEVAWVHKMKKSEPQLRAHWKPACFGKNNSFVKTITSTFTSWIKTCC